MPVTASRPAPFSPDELLRRRDALAAEAVAAGVDRIVLYGSERSGTAVPWLTRWPVTREAAVVFGTSSGTRSASGSTASSTSRRRTRACGW